MDKTLTPPFGWYGGKTLLAPWVISNFPKHDNYCEPFGGSGAVLMAKKPCRLETYNDLNSGVVNFYQVLREGGAKLVELERLCELTLHSREQFGICRELIKTLPKEAADIQHAWAWYSCAWQCFGGNIAQRQIVGWGCSNKSSINIAKSYKTIHDFQALRDRLKYVQIENIDALKLMGRMDAPACLFYLDPPYEQTTGNNIYAFTINDSEFIDFILTLKSMVVISGFDCELYRKLDAAGWTRVEKSRITTMTNNTLGYSASRREVLWLNPWAVENLPQRELFA